MTLPCDADFPAALLQSNCSVCIVTCATSPLDTDTKYCNQPVYVHCAMSQ